MVMIVSRAQRKIDHINHALSTGQERKHGFEDIRFVHNSLPNTSVDEIDISTKIGELFLSSPIFINAMTGGGGRETEQINGSLAKAAAQTGVAMAVGSQMAAIKNSEEAATYEVVRRCNPDGIILANLGSEATVEQAKRAVEMIDADAFQIHLNVIQELVMPEGDRSFKQALERIERIVEEVGVPVVVKEVGFGMSHETVEKLSNVGVSIVDVSGYGGTNFSKIENERRARHYEFFNSWGITTAASLIEVNNKHPYISTIGSGGIQSAVDAVKALSIGANAVGMAGTLLRVLRDKGMKGLLEELGTVQDEMKIIMAALGCRTVEELKEVPLVISGDTHHWLSSRGIDLNKYGTRTKM
jgi:isopentenyl-diphosphate delta-isomerase